ncbi:hypothetical protein BHE74_00009460 [Ensete ventricosum]|nr:hypothetical protein GW17_00006145 [Ensete ventricosum]RWW82106.1 hypothetical protein BHE74_00009460 [Ensete ventricosum]
MTLASKKQRAATFFCLSHRSNNPRTAHRNQPRTFIDQAAPSRGRSRAAKTPQHLLLPTTDPHALGKATPPQATTDLRSRPRHLSRPPR